MFPNGTVGTHTITAAFTGDGAYTASGFGPVTFNVLKDGAVLTYTGPPSSLPSKSVTLSGRLTDDMSRNLAGMTVFFNLGSQSCSGVTDGSGTATCTIAKLAQKPGNHTLTSSFAGNGDYVPSSTSVTFVVGETQTTSTSLPTAPTALGGDQYPSLGTEAATTLIRSVSMRDLIGTRAHRDS